MHLYALALDSQEPSEEGLDCRSVVACEVVALPFPQDARLADPPSPHSTGKQVDVVALLSGFIVQSARSGRGWAPWAASGFESGSLLLQVSFPALPLQAFLALGETAAFPSGGPNWLFFFFFLHIPTFNSRGSNFFGFRHK